MRIEKRLIPLVEVDDATILMNTGVAECITHQEDIIIDN